MMLILIAMICFLLAVYLATDNFFSYSFNGIDYYYVEMDEKIDFLREQENEVWIILEEGETKPTLRQRMLIYKLKRYQQSLKPILDDAANDHRIDFDRKAGDLPEEYGLPEMNRQNIADHYLVGLIWVPRLEGSSDDFVVLDCSCTWEEEHGMELLIKNGSSVAWWGNAGPWQWESPADFLAKQNE